MHHPFEGRNDEAMERIQMTLLGAKRKSSPLWIADGTPAASTAGLPVATDEHWSALPAYLPDAATLAGNRVVTHCRTDPAHAPFDMIRTKLLQYLRQNGWSSVAITSPRQGCGKSVVALNLAFSLAHQADCRTVLMDLDLRHPRIAQALGVHKPMSIERFLKRQNGPAGSFLRYGDNLALGINSQPVRLPAELLQSADAAEALQNLRQTLKPDVVVYDLPPMLASDDFVAFLPNVDCVILVVAAEESTTAEIDLCERELSERSNVVGIVLNKCRYAPETQGY